MKIEKMPELLAPAGNMEGLKAAVNNGCNAVYLGGQQFSARQAAANFSMEELEEAFDYCHLRGVKVYVTVNTLYKEQELEQLYEFVSKLYQYGADALILQDLGAAAMIRKAFPQFELHASTQITANHLDDAEFLYQQGFERVVLSRELSIEEVNHIGNNAKAEIEIFVHGALCVCYSGQCIMSSMLGGRSGNRGRCAQPCRLNYDLMKDSQKVADGYLLSPKDMQTLTLLPQFIASGVSSLKIEGRMKNPEYVAGVTGIYRKYLDEAMENIQKLMPEEEDEKKLLQLFNRGGFTEGYFTTHSGSSMMSVERPKAWGLKTGFVDKYDDKHKRLFIRTREDLVPGDGIEIWTKKEPHSGTGISKASRKGEVIALSMEGNFEKNDVVYKTYDKMLMDSLKKTWEKDIRTVDIYAKLSLNVGEEMALTLWDNAGNNVFVRGDVVEAAQKKPLARDSIREKMGKLGGTSFALKDILIEGDENIFIPVSSLNEIRRKGVEALAEKIIAKTKRSLPQEPLTFLEEKEPSVKRKKMTVLVSTKKQFDVAVAVGCMEILYAELPVLKDLGKAINTCHEKGIKLFAALPRVYREITEDIWKNDLQQLLKSNIDGFLVRSLGQLSLISDSGKPFVIDYSMNVFNKASVKFWEEKEAFASCLSPELNLEDIKKIGTEATEFLIYGHLSLMVTQQCPIGNFVGGKEAGPYCTLKGKAQGYTLRDRKGVFFPLVPDCNSCVCTILNSRPLFTLNFFEELLDTPCGYGRLLFTTESGEETKNILYAYDEMMEDPTDPSVQVEILAQEIVKNSTKGHYFRGVE